MNCQKCNPDKISYKDCGKCVSFQTKISHLENECKLREMFYCGRCSDKCLTLDEMKTCENVKDIRKKLGKKTKTIRLAMVADTPTRESSVLFPFSWLKFVTLPDS